MISRDVFAFLRLTSTFTAREVYTFVGYLALIIAGAHLGLHWTMLMGYVRARLGIRFEQTRVMITARGLAAYGVYSLVALNVGSKLLMQPTMEFLDFDTETPAFFGHLIGIVGLFASVSHYALSFASTCAGKVKLQQPDPGW